MGEARLRWLVEGDVAERRVDEDVGAGTDQAHRLGIALRGMLGRAVGFASMEVHNGGAGLAAGGGVGRDLGWPIGHVRIALLARHVLVDARLDDELAHDTPPMDLGT